MIPSASSCKLGIVSVKQKREEVSSFLDESSFVHSYLCGATSSSKPHFHPQPNFICNEQQENICPNSDISAIMQDQHFSLLQIKSPHKIYEVDETLDNEKISDKKAFENPILNLFPDRVIKASNFVDVYSQSIFTKNVSKRESLLRIRNPVKRLASDIDFAVQELAVQLME